MSPETNLNLAVEEALETLRQYSCLQVKTADSEVEKEKLRQALLLITSLSESENLGVCADNSQSGYAALSSYLKALGYPIPLDPNSLPQSDDPVYIKFNAQKMSHFIDSYTGTYRGVLVSCQGEDDNISGTYGHLPLDLFIE